MFTNDFPLFFWSFMTVGSLLLITLLTNNNDDN